MRKWLIVGAMLALPIGAHAEDMWYMAHVGDQLCVPLDRFDETDLHLLRYHSGQMRTPQDFAKVWQARGIVFQWKFLPGNAVILSSNDEGFEGYGAFAMFKDRDVCEEVVPQVMGKH